MRDAEIAKAPVVMVRGTFMPAQPPKLGWGWERDYWARHEHPFAKNMAYEISDIAQTFDSCDV
jgi:hypothetical protein